jgi:DNA-binding SARP family transcriptional activator
MSLEVHLLGRPVISSDAGASYRFRSRKSWALLAYLILHERPPTRAHLASLLFSEADDPLRALRWSLAEIRRALGPGAEVDGDPVSLRLSPDTLVDASVVARGSWTEAVALPGLGSDLLDSLNVRGAAGFASWLLSEQRRLAGASEAIPHEAALGSMAGGLMMDAVAYAVRAVGMNPLDENHQALLIRLYRRSGDDGAAASQYAAFAHLLDAELGVEPGPATKEALKETRSAGDEPRDVVSSTAIAALVEAGAAAVSAGAIEAGVTSLRTAVRMADAIDDRGCRASSRQALGEALIHSLRGQDEEGLTALYAAREIARQDVNRLDVAQASAELGYVDFLRARYDRAEVWLTDAVAHADGSHWILAKATTYLGSVESDRADYRRALDLLDQAVLHSRAASDARREAYSVAMAGRVHLLRDDLDSAVAHLDAAIDLCESAHWLSFLPWPQAMRGEVELRRGSTDAAAAQLEHAFARACLLGDPCWEGMAARGLALVAEATGDVARAFAVLADARIRCNRVADPYVWLDAYILDAQCELGLRHGHPDVSLWIDALRTLASRTAMREFTVRSMLHAAGNGDDEAGAGAALLAEGIDNPALQHLLARRLELAG